MRSFSAPPTVSAVVVLAAFLPRRISVIFFWVLTGICGVVASYLAVRPALYNTAGPHSRILFRAQDAASVGASGALFGLIGVLFVFGIKFRHELPEGFKRAFGTGMLPPRDWVRYVLGQRWWLDADRMPGEDGQP